MSDEEVVENYQKDVMQAIDDICNLAKEKNWTYMTLMGACNCLARAAEAAIKSGLVQEWDKQ